MLIHLSTGMCIRGMRGTISALGGVQRIVVHIVRVGLAGFSV
ncbi:MAG: hypothetical protein R3F46_05295 [bacterium]